MPSLADMLRAHAKADARPDLVACGGRGEEFATAQVAPQLGDRQQRRQHHCADMQDARAMQIVELEALHLGAIGERGVRRG